jgi:hypothetical protein
MASCTRFCPLSGSVETAVLLITCPTAAFSVCSIAALAVTSMVCSRAPILHVEVESRGLADFELEAVIYDGLEPRSRSSHGILSWNEVHHVVGAGVVRDSVNYGIGGLVGDSDLNVGNRADLSSA